MFPRRDKLERESTSTAVVESTLANVISSCLEGSATRKLGKVRPAARTAGSGPFWLGGVRSTREEDRERERQGEKKEHPRAWLYRGVNGGEHKASPRLHARPRSFTVPLFMLITSKWSQIHGTECRRWSGSGLLALAKYGWREGGRGRTGWIHGSFWSCKEGGSVRVGREETSRVENKIQAESFAS